MPRVAQGDGGSLKEDHSKRDSIRLINKCTQTRRRRVIREGREPCPLPAPHSKLGAIPQSNLWRPQERRQSSNAPAKNVRDFREFRQGDHHESTALWRDVGGGGM